MVYPERVNKYHPKHKNETHGHDKHGHSITHYTYTQPRRAQINLDAKKKRFKMESNLVKTKHLVGSPIHTD